jgi:hypothetical protein
LSSKSGAPDDPDDSQIPAARRDGVFRVRRSFADRLHLGKRQIGAARRCGRGRTASLARLHAGCDARLGRNPADGLWAAESAAKLSDQDWLLADQDAADLAAATALMSLPGTGKNDQKWIANADWHMWTLDVQKTALAIRQAVKAKNQMMLASGADHLADTCQTCHDKYRPETPSDGIIRYPFYPKRVPAK